MMVEQQQQILSPRSPPSRRRKRRKQQQRRRQQHCHHHRNYYFHFHFHFHHYHRMMLSRWFLITVGIMVLFFFSSTLVSGSTTDYTELLLDIEIIQSSSSSSSSNNNNNNNNIIWSKSKKQSQSQETFFVSGSTTDYTELLLDIEIIQSSSSSSSSNNNNNNNNIIWSKTQSQEKEKQPKIIKEDVQRLLEWINSSDKGYVNPKHNYYFDTNKGSSSSIGKMIALEDINEGETLLEVPWDLILKSKSTTTTTEEEEDEEEEDGESDGTTCTDQMCCSLVQTLVDEIKLFQQKQKEKEKEASSSSSSFDENENENEKSSSKFEPYLLYLLNLPPYYYNYNTPTTTTNTNTNTNTNKAPPDIGYGNPSIWSQQGKILLQSIVGGEAVDKVEIPPVEPTEWIQVDYKECFGLLDEDDDDDDKIVGIGIVAALLVVQKSDDNIMVPGYDLYNHFNGRINTETIIETGISSKTIATKFIPKGTEIYISYNLCNHCNGRATEYGTAEIFRDYGFVEEYPQIWHYMGQYQFALDYSESKVAKKDTSFLNNILGYLTTSTSSSSSSNKNKNKEESETEESTTKDIKDQPFKLQWYSNNWRPDEDDYQRFLVFLKRQIRRLRRIRNIHENFIIPKQIEGLPQNHPFMTYELDRIWQFLEANIIAMRAAIISIEMEFNITRIDNSLVVASMLNKKKGEEGGACSTPDDGDNTNNNVEEGVCATSPVQQQQQAPPPKEITSVYYINGSHYDLLQDEYDDVNYRGISTSCDDFHEYILNYHDHYDEIEEIQTSYQQLNFGYSFDPDLDDICMDIDEIIQICSSYRPQYHEYVVHAAARFVNDVRRVLFLGGGDSMLLYEILKYPSIELVVGLELDQEVVRKSFKHFKTQPYFDDPRVEWWFGDATKSLLLLPKDYWQSFDLVLVDLSETVMSLSVNNELDVLDALGLLLNPNGGVIVKNEYYMDAFSNLFDYTAQYYFDCPIICNQAIVLGSNSVDFFKDMPTKRHDDYIETLLYEPLTSRKNHLYHMHDYRKNDARRSPGKCDDIEKKKKNQRRQQQSNPSSSSSSSSEAGIVAIVNAENISGNLLDKDTITTLIRNVIEGQGFSLLLQPMFIEGSVFAVFHEGYIVARLWPQYLYIAFDINLWAKTHKLKSLKNALIESLGSSTIISSYNIVVGGMAGYSPASTNIHTLDEKEKENADDNDDDDDEANMVGPQIVQTRNSCADPFISTDMTTTSEELIDVGLKGTIMDLVARNVRLKGVVFCGIDRDDCVAATSLREYQGIASLEKLSTCEGLDKDDVSEDDMLECEYQTLKKLRQLAKSPEPEPVLLNLIIVDAAVPYPMLQVLNSILGDTKDRMSLIQQEKHMFVVLSTDPDGENFRQRFLDRYRKQHLYDPISKAQILFQSGTSSLEIGVVACGQENFGHKLEEYESKLRTIFSRMRRKDIMIEIQSLVGGTSRYRDDDDFDPPRFKQSDYDSTPGLTQYKQQKPLGRQNIFQFVAKDETVEYIDMSALTLGPKLKDAIESIGLNIIHHKFVDGFGDGCIHVIVLEEGNVFGVWDGRKHVDINLFTYQELPKVPEAFIKAMNERIEELALALRDDQPRGIRRVINLPSDIEY